MLTEGEARDAFVRHIRTLVEYWERLDREGRSMTCGDRLDGLAFSILVMLDGDSLGMPGFSLTARGAQAQEWPASDISDGALHERYVGLDRPFLG